MPPHKTFAIPNIRFFWKFNSDISLKGLQINSKQPRPHANFVISSIIITFAMAIQKILDSTRMEQQDSRDLAAIWQTATGVQAGDGLEVSEYLRQSAQKHISGQITIDKVQELIMNYYLDKNAQEEGDPDKEGADKVAVNIVRLLINESALELSKQGLSALNRSIFDGVYENAGELRDYEEYKREWVLGGDTLRFTNLEALPDELEQCISKELNFDYDTATSDDFVSHLSAFIAQIWHICPFGEGNTRFTAVLTLLYLSNLGVNIEFDTFRNDTWYFHNALVRANYQNSVKNINFEPIYLERFFRNMLLGEQWELRNRYVHVRPAAEWRVQPKANNETITGQVEVKKDTRKVKEQGKKDASKIRKIEPESPNLLFLTVAIGQDFLSVKEIMEKLRLKGRDNFLKSYLTPAIQRGLVSLLYPSVPRHPRQKYLLTTKGLDFLKATDPEMVARVQRHLNGSGI